MVIQLQAHEPHYSHSTKKKKTFSVVEYGVHSVFNTIIKNNQYFLFSNNSQNTKCEITITVVKKENQYDAE